MTLGTEPAGGLDEKTFIRRMFSDAATGASQHVVEQSILDKIAAYAVGGGRVIFIGEQSAESVEGKKWSAPASIVTVPAVAEDRAWLTALQKELSTKSSTASGPAAAANRFSFTMPRKNPSHLRSKATPSTSRRTIWENDPRR